MSYQVLARKWRPRSFEDMVGQEHVLQALIHALENQRLHHAYLFTGTRGVGKTTIGRLLARCLNCETGITPHPCGKCASCQEIQAGRFVDLIEIDAASRTGVDDMRELTDNVQYAPTRGRYKVYLIDEVHMLTNQSFNAFLKTLEEPPEHVKFLLATTDPQKLPVTVLSRCLQFNLKRMTPEHIVGHLKHVLTEEQIPFEDPALWLLARAADGSMRDALSLTDQAIAFGNENQELDVFRRLVQGFQKGVEGLVGEHVHLIDEVHLVAAARGSVLHVVGQFPHVIYTGAGGSIDFDQINKTVLQDLLAAVAFTAGIRRYAGLTVQTAGQQAANGGFAHAPGAGKQIGMVQALVFQGVNKRL